MWWLYTAIGVGILLAIGVIGNRNKLKGEYEASLKGTDKEKALKAGRAYYSALRSGSLTIYDEQAIANDLHSMKGSATTAVVQSNNSIIEQLEKLGELKAKGILSEDEFNQQKAKLLNG